LELCDECPVSWRARWDLTLGDGGWAVPIDFPVGVYVGAVGWRTSNYYGAGEYNTRCYIQQSFDSPATFTVTKMSTHVASVTYQAALANGSWTCAIPPHYDQPIMVKPDGTGTHERTFDTDYEDAEVFRFDFRTNNGNEYGGQMTIDVIEIYGTGDAPQEFIDNATEFEYF
jgi:hypothetical protein